MSLTLPSTRTPARSQAANERSRRYSRSIYLWTLSQWDENRADIERRTATAALNAILSGQRVGTPSSSRTSSLDDKDGFFP
ncbi:hypothetical protein CC85DRAFT_326113 [Cutaneotrichosporon oleaginosum]|uniref:Uncharacterized protein n=1 Tax=Cutaneotrichosporon oleaginosum TaxID=879819 RepID=A0A0J0XUS6_9TREE|nr:uncharacterized protein CC85DRAFT_326113 [Cutaneotrichosporon oleaginosum]KLT44833.1 hypothetical protein CC85DRAFT_326113 [Cutaneotrichosporon oleaginosum]TXT11971.1 hypothetical protein COLE_02381 [Cutaneotrichosporon oleaginosum]